ncbi:helicase HerA-like domain-containing protein [uncultured Lutibacter sp.]|uniref:helicase HerA-like domain-containing protein n=1 Tax=uncultured Lutibacter sp. TaxID=437739 RepID=UPI00260DAA05|nr:helicase HerA-like domain-containing protein [uncultured Lutibacter sp.]
MNKEEVFFNHITEGYKTKGDFITFGSAMLNGTTIKEAFVKVPLKTLNRHGLIAGATGTGKTKSLQVMAENLSEKGIPVLLMDIKGDLSGLAQPSPGHAKIDERHAAIGLPFDAKKFPVEILTISEQKGTRLRATVSEFGPVLLSRILDLSDAQSGIVSIVFQYCDDHKLPLLDLNDFKKVLQYATDEGKEEIQSEYGLISKASTGAILRKILEIDQQGGDLFFGERSFDVQDLVRVDENGKGIISILRLTDIQDKPKLFSTFMLQLLAEIYSTFPEQGDSGKPELVIFIDEAHLIFKEASKALLSQIESIVKLIRSKGIGLFFVTQNPNDVPEDILGQLGLKVQHALRAFTAKDRKAIKLAAENYPSSEYYDVDEVLTQLGIGEAFISVLNEKGIPTPLACTMMRAPMSRMDILTDKELKQLIENSRIYYKYNETIDRESAYEILSEKIETINEKEAVEEKKKEELKRSKSTSSRTRTRKSTRMNPILKVVTSATFIRGILGILKRVI